MKSREPTDAITVVDYLLERIHLDGESPLSLSLSLLPDIEPHANLCTDTWRMGARNALISRQSTSDLTVIPMTTTTP